MIRLIKLSVASLLLIFLSSCEGGTTYTKTIENNSSETLTVNGYSVYWGNNSIIVGSDKTKDIWIDSQLGSFVNDSYQCTQGIDSIEVDVTDNKTLVLDVLDNNNWIRESSGGRKSSVNCILEITDEDLQ